MVDGGQGFVLGEDAALILVQLFGGVDAAADGPACIDLRLHCMRAVQPTMLGHHLAPTKMSQTSKDVQGKREKDLLPYGFQKTCHHLALGLPNSRHPALLGLQAHVSPNVCRHEVHAL